VMYTHTYRMIMRLALDKAARYSDELGTGSVWASWTDKPRWNDTSGSDKRIVTYSLLGGSSVVLNEVKKLMELVGFDPKSHGLRMSRSGYIKCNCVLPGSDVKL